MKKDFLFLNFSFVLNSEIYFKYFGEKGYLIDIITEKENSFLIETNNTYRYIVVYNYHMNEINYHLKNKFKDSIIIQHDDTDEEHIQKWIEREPTVYMQREYTKNTKTLNSSKIIPFHFPMKSIYNEKLNKEKIYDISFVGNITNNRRRPFIDKLQELKNGSLKHLRWYIDIGTGTSTKGVPTQKFTNIINQSKIGLHYFGNSYDSIRIWEILSCKTALLMPFMRNISVDKDHMFLEKNKDYCVFDDDLSNLEEKILYLLENDNYKTYAEQGHKSSNEKHNTEKCCDYYYTELKKYLKF